MGFAAETGDSIAHARRKRGRKGGDWSVGNGGAPETDAFGGDANTGRLITADGVGDWPRVAKAAVAERLAERVAETLTAAS